MDGVLQNERENSIWQQSEITILDVQREWVIQRNTSSRLNFTPVLSSWFLFLICLFCKALPTLHVLRPTLFSQIEI